MKVNIVKDQFVEKKIKYPAILRNRNGDYAFAVSSTDGVILNGPFMGDFFKNDKKTWIEGEFQPTEGSVTIEFIQD